MTLAVQYLEPGSHVAAIAPEQARACLRAAFERLPISLVLLGWDLPAELFAACAEETARAGARLFRWHPLLAGDGALLPQPAWQTVGLSGDPVPAFQGRPEFTFLCPNRPAVREAVLDHLRDVLQGGKYDGVFLDRIRYPSPAADPATTLACFCEDCQRAAARAGFDLEAARQSIRRLAATPEYAARFVQALLDRSTPAGIDADLALLGAFLAFRALSVTGLVQAAASLVSSTGLAVGLDCFSPGLAWMVGQDLGALAAHGQWIKIMSYAHTLGPAGLPSELLSLAQWLMQRHGADEADALAWLARATGLPLPGSATLLRERGLAPEALAAEVGRGRAAGIRVLFVGIELVELVPVTHLDRAQIQADLRALLRAGVDGLVLSWDLWHIPLDRLELVRATWVGEDEAPPARGR